MNKKKFQSWFYFNPAFSLVERQKTGFSAFLNDTLIRQMYEPDSSCDYFYKDKKIFYKPGPIQYRHGVKNREQCIFVSLPKGYNEIPKVYKNYKNTSITNKPRPTQVGAPLKFLKPILEYA